MNLKMLFKAAFKMKNFVLLAAIAIITYVTGYLPFTLIGLAGYIYFVTQTLKDEAFQKAYMDEEMLDSLQELSDECRKLYARVRYKVDYHSRERIKAVLEQMKELMEYFNKDSDDPLNRRIIEQALNLVMAYIKLIFNYSTRYKEVSSIDLSGIQARINRNNRKLGNLKSYDAVLQLTKAIEMDEKLLEDIGREKNELETVSTKLDHIESMISAFKHQIISNESINPAVEDIESVINEAAALDHVLNEKRRQKL